MKRQREETDPAVEPFSQVMKAANLDKWLRADEKRTVVNRGNFNDHMVDFFCQEFIKPKGPMLLAPDASQGDESIYLLSTNFFAYITVGGKAIHDMDVVEEKIKDVVAGWKLPLIDKKYILLPINQHDSHWMLYVIVNPFDKYPPPPGQLAPTPTGKKGNLSVYVFDSMNYWNDATDTYHMSCFHCLRLFFVTYARHNNIPFDPDLRRSGFIMCHVPKQDPGKLSCGMHIALYVDKFFQSPMLRDAIIALASSERTKARATRAVVMADLTSDYVEMIYQYVIKKYNLLS